MPGGPGKLKGNEFGAGFDINPQNINRTGQNISIRKQIRELLADDGKMVIEAKQVKKINDDGSVEIVLPTQMAVAMKLFHWAMSNKEGASTKAIQMIMEHIDGKAHQSMSIESDQPVIQYEVTDEQVENILNELKPGNE